MKSIIKIYIKDKNDYTNAYNRERLSPDLLSYILEEHKAISFKHNIEIQVYSPHSFTEEEKHQFVDILRSNLGEDIKESYLEMKLIHIKTILLTIIGIFFIFISSFIAKHTIFSEILLIIGWVGIWEACYSFFFENTQSRIKIKKYKKLVHAKVKFYEEN